MAVAGRILVQIILMVFIGREEAFQREQFNGKRFNAKGLPDLGKDRCKFLCILLIVIVNTCAITGTNIFSLFVEA